MAVSLVNANGDPISTFGSGNTAYAQGNKTNAFESQSDPFDYADDKSAPTLLSPRVFSDSTDVNQGEATQTVAGSTAGLGYGSLSDIKAPRGTRRGGGGGGQSSGRAGAKLNPDEEIGLKAAKPGTAQTKEDGPSEDEQDDMAARDAERQMGMPSPWRDGGRNAAAAQGAGEGRPGGDVPGGMPDTGQDGADDLMNEGSF